MFITAPVKLALAAAASRQLFLVAAGRGVDLARGVLGHDFVEASHSLIASQKAFRTRRVVMADVSMYARPIDVMFGKKTIPGKALTAAAQVRHDFLFTPGTTMPRFEVLILTVGFTISRNLYKSWPQHGPYARARRLLSGFGISDDDWACANADTAASLERTVKVFRAAASGSIGAINLRGPSA